MCQMTDTGTQTHTETYKDTHPDTHVHNVPKIRWTAIEEDTY